MDIKLEEVKDGSLLSLKDKLCQAENPQAILIINLLHMKILYPELTQKFYAFERNKNLFVFAINVCTSKILKPVHLFWPVEEFSSEEAVLLLRSLPDQDWKNPLLVTGDPIERQFQTKEMFLKAGVIGTDYQFHQFTNECIYELSKISEELPDDALPKGFKFGKLHPLQMPWIFSKWDATFSEDLKDFQRNITFLPSVAVYLEDDDEETSNPVSWILQYSYGFIGLAFTLPEYRNQGLWTAAMTRLNRKILAKGQKVYLMSENYKTSVIQHHLKYGFKRMVETHFYTYLPKGTTIDGYINCKTADS